MDNQRNQLSSTKTAETRLNQDELELVEDALQVYGLHNKDPFAGVFYSADLSRGKKLNTFPQSFKILADIYYRSGHLRLTTDALGATQSFYS